MRRWWVVGGEVVQGVEGVLNEKEAEKQNYIFFKKKTCE